MFYHNTASLSYSDSERRTNNRSNALMRGKKKHDDRKATENDWIGRYLEQK